MSTHNAAIARIASIHNNFCSELKPTSGHRKVNHEDRAEFTSQVSPAYRPQTDWEFERLLK